MTVCTYPLTALHPQHPPPSSPSWKFRFQMWWEGRVPACNHATESTVSQTEQLLIMPVVQPTESGSCLAATWSFPTWIIPDIPEPVQFTQASTFACRHLADIGGRRRGQANMSPCGVSYKNTKPFARNRETQTDVPAERQRTPPPWLGLCFPPEKTCSWFKWCVFAAYRTSCRTLNTWGDSGVFDLGQRWLRLQTSYIGHVVVTEMCRNYMWLWPESKLWWRWPHPTSPTRLHQTKQKKKERSSVWHQLDWAAEPVCRWEP